MADGHWIMFETDTVIKIANGMRIHVEWGSGTTGTGFYDAGGGWRWDGPVSGPIVTAGTNQVDFRIGFTRIEAPFGDDSGPQSPPVRYKGAVNSDGSAQGDARAINNVHWDWTIGHGFKYIDDRVMRRISDDVDIYIQPGGVGEPAGIVRKGTLAHVLQRRQDNWVQISFFLATTQVIGWVWGDFVPA